MKPTVAIAVAVLAVLAESSPVGQLAKRSTTCALTGSDVRYHVAPSVKSSAPGQFGAKGTKVAFTCWTEGINGDSDDWVRDTSGYYVDFRYISSACFANIQTYC